jgi:GMP synthase-like glutamine amidotransferase
LIVNCYRKLRQQRIEDYASLADLFGSWTVLSDTEFEHGLDLSPYDGIVLSGSERMLSTRHGPTELSVQVRTLTQPTLGICYGHQLLAYAHGAKILKRGEGPVFRRFAKKCEWVDVLEEDDILYGLAPQFRVAHSHYEYVDPQGLDQVGFVILASSDSCPVEVIHHCELPLYGVQFHIERSGRAGYAIMKNFVERVVAQRRLKQMFS